MTLKYYHPGVPPLYGVLLIDTCVTSRTIALSQNCHQKLSQTVITNLPQICSKLYLHPQLSMHFFKVVFAFLIVPKPVPKLSWYPLLCRNLC